MSNKTERKMAAKMMLVGAMESFEKVRLLLGKECLKKTEVDLQNIDTAIDKVLDDISKSGG